MTKQLAKISSVRYGCYYIVYDNQRKINPFGVYLLRNNHKTQVARYGDYGSCLWTVNERIKGDGSFYLEKI